MDLTIPTENSTIAHGLRNRKNYEEVIKMGKKQDKPGTGIKPGPNERKIRNRKRKWILVKGRLAGYVEKNNQHERDFIQASPANPLKYEYEEEEITNDNGTQKVLVLKTKPPLHVYERSLIQNQSTAFELLEESDDDSEKDDADLETISTA